MKLLIGVDRVNSKHTITSTQFLFTIICIIQSSTILNAVISGVLYNEAWIGIIIAIIGFIPILFIYNCYMKKYPDKNYLQICEDLFGKIIGKVIGFIYILFFILLTSFNVRDLGYFTQSTMINETPLPVILLVAIVPCCMGVKNGISTTTRYSKIFVISSVVIAGTIMFFLLKEADITNLLPVFNLSKKSYFQGAFLVLNVPFGELVVVLMIHQYLKNENKKARKYLFLGYIIGGFIYLLITVRDIAVLGETFSLFSSPSLVAFQLINIEEIFSRMDILFTVIFTGLLFLKASLFFYVTILSIKTVFNLKETRHLVYILGIFACFIAINISANQVDHIIYSRNSVSILFFFPQVVFPVIFSVFMLFKRKKVT